MSADLNPVSDSVVIRITSDIDANIGFRLVQDYWLESVYRNGYFSSSIIRNVINEKVHADTEIYFNGRSI